MHAKKTVRFSSLTEAAQFYGVGRGPFFEMKRLGDDHSDPLPYDDPAAMPAWFERMMAKGARRRPCPDSVLARACEATAPATATVAAPRKGAPTVKTKKAAAKSPPPAEEKGSAAPPEAPAPVRITLDQQGSVEGIIERQLRLHAGLSTAYENMIAAGTQGSSQGQAIFRQLSELADRILSYQKAAPNIRDADQWLHLDVVRAATTEFMNRMYHFFVRELPAQFPPADHGRVMSCWDLFPA